MTDATPPTRIPPLTPAERTPEANELLAQVGIVPAETANIFLTLARHPGLFRRWLPFGGKLLGGGKLPARHREILILRTAVNCKGAYEWGQHVTIGLQAGLTRDDLGRVAAGPDAAGLDPFDAALLRAADELHATTRIADDTWSTLAEAYSVPQLIEVPMVVGHYTMLAYTLNTLGVPLEEGVEAPPW